MSPKLPSTFRAWINEDKVPTLVDLPLPELKDNEIRLKVIVAALNPTDWKHVAMLGAPKMVCGCDLVGEVVEIGPNINPKVSHKIGDKVVGIVHGGNYTDVGAFAEYTKVPADLVWKVPEGISYEAAATYGVGVLTPVQAFFHPAKLAMVSPPNQAPGSPWIFIYGGSTSVGFFAIQWAKLAGYKVATTTSARNMENIKALGPDAIFDYNDPEVVAKVKKATDDSIHLAFDGFASDESQVMTVEVLGPGAGHVVLTLPPAEKAQSLRPDVKMEGTFLYSIFGTEWHLGPWSFPASPEDNVQMVELMSKQLPELVKEGKIKPQPFKVWPGGLEGIRDGMKFMEDGKVSLEKILFRISN